MLSRKSKRKHIWHRMAFECAPAGGVCEIHGGVLLAVGRLEGELGGLGEVQARPGDLAAWHALRP